MRVVIVGGGVLGTMHAWEAVTRGHEVVHLERELEGRGASVRNFGLIWLSGRAAGAESALAAESRERWERIGAAVPGVGFRACGSLSVARTAAEAAVASATAESMGDRFTLLDPAEARRRNPVLRGRFKAALWCAGDAAVESRQVLPALREYLGGQGAYRWLPGREAREVDAGLVRDDHGDVHSGDAVVLCPGAQLGGLVRELGGRLPVRRVRLQMMQTAPLGEPFPTAVADADSFRYYPAYAGGALDAFNAVQPQAETARVHHMQLLMVQRLDGSLTIGDTHEYAEPFGFDTDEPPYDHLREVAAALLGSPLPAVRRRWAGVYAQLDGGSGLLYREEVQPGIWLVTGPGGRGMTMSPGFAAQTADLINL